MTTTINASTSSGLVNTADTSGILQLQTAGTAALTVDASQNVGIGTTSPSFKLDVRGRTQIINSAAGTSTVATFCNDDTSGTSVVKTGFSNGGTIKASINAAVYNNDYMTFNVGSDTERMRIDSSGNVLVTSTSGGLGYGTGTGGTVTQLTSKSTSVTLNKITGRIITNNAALAANTVAQFVVNNTLATTTDTIIVNVWESGLSLDKYIVTASPGGANGYFYIQVRNTSAGSLSDAVNINYTIIKGSTS